MEFVITVSDQTENTACDNEVRDLSDLQLALVGGGSGDVVFH